MRSAMNSKQRIRGCLDRTGIDRLPVDFCAVPEICAALAGKLGCRENELDRIFGLDIRGVGPKYRGPEMKSSPDGTREGWWGEIYSNQHNQSGVYQEVIYLPYA